MCLDEAQVLVGGPGHAPPGKFWKNGAKFCNFMHSGSKNRVITAWSAHKSTQKLKKENSFAGSADLVAAREGSSEPPEPPLGTGLSLISRIATTARRF